MALAPGSRLGPYEILSPLGAGGMGEVWRARDTRLGRDVAVKVLPGKFAADPEMRHRFEQEARTISQLSHPNICAIFDVGTQDGTAFLVMELLEGESLAERLVKGPLPLQQALRVGREICLALAAAHRKGIVHRDLKPANVMLSSSGVKLLDFGLAKLRERVEAGEVSQLRTQAAAPRTGAGIVVGTLAYMAPEQLEGRPADVRTDLFAFGTVLFEMVTGRRPFAGESSAAIITAILAGEPPAVSTIRALSPPALDRIVRTCLAKDPDSRWQSAADLGRELSWIERTDQAATGTAAGREASAMRVLRGRRLPWVVAAVAAAAAAAALLRPRAPASALPQIVRFELAPPKGSALLTSVETTVLAVSPDGSKLAFVVTDTPRAGPSLTGASASGEAHAVWVRDLAGLESRVVPGTEGASSVFWSPDSRSLGFFTAGKLQRIDLAGSAAVPVCDLPVGGGFSGTWGSGGDILFTSIQGNTIFRVPASGGTPAPFLQGDASRGEVRLSWPSFLPDGQRFVYLARLRDRTARIMYWAPGGGTPRPIVTACSSAQYAEPGYLLYVRDGTLLAQRLNGKNGRLSGEPVSVAPRVNYFLSNGRAAFAVSASGTLAYQPRESVSHIAWVDRAGREVGTLGSPGNYFTVSFSRDGRRVVFDRREPGIGTFDVWSFDLERNVESRITSSPETEADPRELSDGSSIFYSGTRGGQPQLCRLDLAGGREELLVPGEGTFQWVEDISPDGKTLFYTERTATTPFDIWALPLSPRGAPVRLLGSRFSKSQVRLSPDGRFLSFVSDESGQPEAYVMPYPGPGEKSRVSSGGARLLRWSRDGRELLCLSADQRFLSVPVRTSPTLAIGAPRELFRLEGKPWSSFEPSPDGKLILAVVPDLIADEQPLTVVVNAFAEPRS